MKKLVFLVALASLTGCVTETVRTEVLETEVGPYYNCVGQRAMEMAHLREDPYYIALAAKSRCAKQRAEARAAIQRIYGRSLALELYGDMERSVTELAISAVVRVRSQS